MEITFNSSYKKTLKWHILIDVILIAGMLVSTDRLFMIKGDSFFDTYFAITLGILSFLHGFVMLCYLLGILTEKKWWTALFALIHLGMLVLFFIYSYMLLVMHFGAPSVGD